MTHTRSFWARNNQLQVWLLVALGVALFAPTLLFRFLFIDVRSVTVSPSDMTVTVERSIARDFEGSFTAQIRHALTHEVICRGSSGHTFPYSAAAAESKPVQVMGFWKWAGITTDEQKRFCRASGMVDGATVYVNTCHYAHAPWGMPLGRRCVASEPFTVPAGSFDSLGAELRELSARVVGRTPEGWHRADMAEWVAEFVRTGIPPDPYKLPSYLERVQ